jgi:hypothetical protein
MADVNNINDEQDNLEIVEQDPSELEVTEEEAGDVAGGGDMCLALLNKGGKNSINK